MKLGVLHDCVSFNHLSNMFILARARPKDSILSKFNIL